MSAKTPHAYTTCESCLSLLHRHNADFTTFDDLTGQQITDFCYVYTKPISNGALYATKGNGNYMIS